MVKILQADVGHSSDIFHIKKAYCEATLKNLNTERYLLPDLIEKETNRSIGPGWKEGSMVGIRKKITILPLDFHL